MDHTVRTPFAAVRWRHVSRMLAPCFPLPLALLQRRGTSKGKRHNIGAALLMAYILHRYTAVWALERDEYGAPMVRAYQTFSGEKWTLSIRHLVQAFGFRERNLRYMLQGLQQEGLIGREHPPIRKERGRFQGRRVRIWPIPETLSLLLGCPLSPSHEDVLLPPSRIAPLPQRERPHLFPLTSPYVKAVSRLRLGASIPISLRLLTVLRDHNVPNVLTTLVLYAYLLHQGKPTGRVTTLWNDLTALIGRSYKHVRQILRGLALRDFLTFASGGEGTVEVVLNLSGLAQRLSSVPSTAYGVTGPCDSLFGLPG